MKKFRLLIGTHNEGKVNEDGSPVLDPKTNKQIFETFQVTRDGAGNYHFPIIRTDRDLDKTFNAGPDSQKFQRVYGEESDELPVGMIGMQQDTLSDMTVDELRKYADEESIDVTKCKTKEQVLKTIREALQPA